uniref:Uncharacterized protein n=1 Tax=Onchocerca volvulus TaxID=6282 RepID=A0A8R1XZ32_ONCVO
MLMWCICHKLSCAKRAQLSNIQISDTLSENSAQRTEFVRTAWSDTTYCLLFIVGFNAKGLSYRSRVLSDRSFSSPFTALWE